MSRKALRSFAAVGLMSVAVLVFGSEANAGWGHWRAYSGAPNVSVASYGYGYGYYGGLGYYGGWNTYGWGGTGCYGCYRPIYAGYFGCARGLAYRMLHHHWTYYGGLCGYRGYCGSCYRSPCCCDVCGCGVVNCGCSCCGGAVAPAEGDVLYDNSVVDPGSAPATPPPAPTPAPPKASGAQPLPEKQTSLSGGNAMLTVHVPQAARVMVNGVATRSTGSLRRYVSRNLTPGFDYTYEVRAEAVVNGEPVTRTKTVRLRAGEMANLAFDMDLSPAVETSLTLHVPADATVYLAGNKTAGTGPERTFRTTKLAEGKTWSDYAVRVVIDREGHEMAKEQTIALAAGETRELTFDFNVDKLASTR